jgi:glycosyltransferase involved in cell wall biosynthesis
VHFHGYLAPAELQRQLAHAWVQAAPSLFEEPAGIVGYEAAMRGTALVASNYGGFGDAVVAGKSGFLTPPGDIAELTRALLALLSDKGRAEEYGNAGRRRAKQQFTIDRMVDQYLDLYHEVIQTSGAKPGKAASKNRTF